MSRETLPQMLNRLSRGEGETPDVAYLLQIMNDRGRYLLCKSLMEYYRTLWYAGRDESVRLYTMYMTKSMRKRYRGYSTEALRAIGAVQWVRSVQARDYVDLEQMYCRWAGFYVKAMEVAA